MINSVSSLSFKGLHPYGTGNDGSIARAQAYGYACRMAQRADELRQTKMREYSCGLISDRELKKFMSAPTDRLIRYLESPCCDI